MSQIVIRIDVPDGISVSVTREPGSVLDEPLPTEPGYTNGGSQPTRPVAAQSQKWTEGQVHEQGHKPLRTNRRGLFCPTKMPDDSWCPWQPSK